jgi:hypothetical protein
MDSIAPILAVVYGLFAGVFVWGIAARWLYIIADTWRTYRSTDTTESLPRTGPWALLLVFVLHSGPWALAIAGYLSYYVLSRPHAPWWAWFFGGAALAPLFVGTVVLRAMRKRKRLQVNGTSHEA